MNQVIGGFQLNANLTLDGGIPFTTNYQLCNQDNDIGSDDNACFLNKVPGKSFGISKGNVRPDCSACALSQAVALHAAGSGPGG